MLILNAGVFPAGTPIQKLGPEEWRKVFSVNLEANLTLMRECYPLLKLAPKGGRVVVIGSKNVAAPGPGAAAYSASKAALTQLARVAALEWGADGIRVNTLHPNAVFDTGLWTEEVLKARAESYGLSVEEYKRNNVLKTEVRSRDVGELAAELCGPTFARTTGADSGRWRKRPGDLMWEKTRANPEKRSLPTRWITNDTPADEALVFRRCRQPGP